MAHAIDRNRIVQRLQAQGDYDRAANAGCELPAFVDEREDRGVLASLGVDVDDFRTPEPGRVPTPSPTSPRRSEPGDEAPSA